MTPTPRPESARAIAEQVVQRVAELPDRTSPDDWPEVMLVTSEELTAIVLAACGAPADGFRVLGSGYEAGFDAGYDKGYSDGLDESAGDPRVERIEAAFKAMHSATNGDYSREDMVVMDGLQAGRDFAVRLARREQHIQQLIDERAAPSASPAPREAETGCCREPAPDRTGRLCDMRKGHDGDHWTYGMDTLTWPAQPTDGRPMISAAETLRQFARLRRAVPGRRPVIPGDFAHACEAGAMALDALAALVILDNGYRRCLLCGAQTHMDDWTPESHKPNCKASPQTEDQR